MAASAVARLGTMRVGAARLGYYQPWIKVFVNGLERTTTTRVSECSITDELNHEPNTAVVKLSGSAPVKGQSITVYMGDTNVEHQLFGGRILSVAQTYEAEKSANVIWVCQCIDYTWLLNRRKVIKKYTSQSATAIVLDLLSTYTAGFTSVNVATGLATLDEITFTDEDVTDALTRIAERLGAYWYVDYSSDLHFYLSETITAGPITQAAPRGQFDIAQDVDLSQVATRVTARGGGSNVLSDVAVGGATIPVGDSSWYVAPGTVECGPQRITYTGVASAGETGSATGYIAPPPAISIVGGSGGSLTAGATYIVAGTYTTAEGETSAGVTSTVTLGGAQNEILYSSFIAPSDPKITVKSIYLSDPNGAASTLKKVTAVALATTSGTILAAGSGAIPTTNAAGFGALSTDAGATSMLVDDCAQFLAAGGWAEAPGGQIFSYTGRSVSSGPGSLTGIPASGIGSLTAAVRAGTVKSVPHLTGCSGIVYALVSGDPVNLVVTVNDAAAQTAMAGFVGGDGIHEMFITDGRWSITEATARANAELTLRKDPLVTVRFKSRDQSLQSGRDLTITLTSPAISGTFKIQRVTITELGLAGPTGFLFPLREVEASSRRYSFEDVLRQLKGT